MLSEQQKEQLWQQASEFEYYVKNVRGYLATPCGMRAIILYTEFQEWQSEQKTNSKGKSR